MPNKNPNHVKHPSRSAVNARKRDEASARAIARAKRSPKQQLATLDKRPGAAEVERARLLRRVTETPPRLR